MRDEYIAHLDPVRRFVRELDAATYHLTFLEKEEAHDSIREPARLFGYDYDQEVYADFALLRRERATTDAAIEAWAAGLTAEHLAAPFSYRSSAGQRYDHPLWWAVIHFFNHQTHHRGQLTTLLTQLGHDSGVTDLVSLLREPS